jgi:hypothetical protein
MATADGSTGDGRRATGWRAPLAVAAVVAIVSSSAFAYFLFTKPSGTPTPESAVIKMVEAAQTGDVVGVLEALSSDEREILKGSATDLQNALQKLGMLGPFDLRRVPGAVVSADGLGFSTERLADKIVAVDVTSGRIVAKIDPDKVPLSNDAKEIIDRSFEVDVRSGSFTRDFAQYPLRVVTLDDGSGWHVSIGYSIAESVRVKQSKPAPAFGAGVAPAGSPTPEGAVRDLLDAYLKTDPARAVALIAPDEAASLRDYAPLFVPQAKPAGLNGSKVNNIVLSTDGSGDTRRVHVTSLDVEIVDEIEDRHITYDGHCLDVDYRFSPSDQPFAGFHTCDGDRSPDTTTTVDPDRAPQTTTTGDPDHAPQTTTTGDPDRAPGTATTVVPGAPLTEAQREAATRSSRPPPDDPLSLLAIFGGGADFPTFTVVQRSAQWYMSPVQTVLASVLDTLAANGPDSVAPFIERIRLTFEPSNPEAAAEARDPDNTLFGPSVKAKSPLIAGCFLDVLAVAGDAGLATYTPICIRHLVTSGAVDGATVNPMLLFNECSQAQPQSPPAQDNVYRRLFLAKRAARACVQRHIDAGEAPASVLQGLGDPKDDRCLGPYQALDPSAPEAVWAAADEQVKPCVDALTNNNDPGTILPRR